MSDMNWTRIISLIGPLFLTFSAFWVYFKGKALKEREAKLSPFLWAILVYFLFIITFPIFLILKETKWKKEAIGITPSHKMNQWQRILVIVIFFIIYIFTVLLIPFININNQQEVSDKSNTLFSASEAIEEITEWKTYNSGQDIMGFSLNIPTGWTVNFSKGKYILPGELSGVGFDFAPPEWSSANYSYSYMGWGVFYIKFYNPETDIDKWIDKHLSDFKDGLIVTKEGQIGGKSIFALNKGESWDEEKLGVVWNPYHVILGTEYSYSYGFSQDGANNFAQIIEEKIFPNISIK